MKPFVVFTLLASLVLSSNSFATAEASAAVIAPVIRCEIGTSAEALMRASDLRAKTPNRDVSQLVLQTLELKLESDVVFFDEVPESQSPVKSFTKDGVTLKVYSMMNEIYVDLLKEESLIFHSVYRNFEGDAGRGGFTGHVGVGDYGRQIAYTCFRVQ